MPWKSLTTAPVEVTLSDLFIIISAEHPDAWQFQDYAGFKKKFELLEKFKEQIIKNITDKAKPKDVSDLPIQGQRGRLRAETRLENYR